MYNNLIYIHPFDLIYVDFIKTSSHLRIVPDVVMTFNLHGVFNKNRMRDRANCVIFVLLCSTRIRQRLDFSKTLIAKKCK